MCCDENIVFVKRSEKYLARILIESFGGSPGKGIASYTAKSRIIIGFAKTSPTRTHT